MKVCKSLYSAFLPLGCKDSSQQFQHPPAARGNSSQWLLHFEKRGGQPWRREIQDDLWALSARALGQRGASPALQSLMVLVPCLPLL